MSKNLDVKKALNVVELEERFEMTVAAVDTARCDGNKVELSAEPTEAAQ
jgi:hypothetical protein